MNRKLTLAALFIFALTLAACGQGAEREIEVNKIRAECVSNHGQWNETANTCVEAPTEKDECEKLDGQWVEGEVGLSATYVRYCELPAADAGKTCTDSDACDKYCEPICEKTGGCSNYEDFDQESGMCATFSSGFGCNSYWKNGSIETMCVD